MKLHMLVHYFSLVSQILVVAVHTELVFIFSESQPTNVTRWLSKPGEIKVFSWQLLEAELYCLLSVFFRL